MLKNTCVENKGNAALSATELPLKYKRKPKSKPSVQVSLSGAKSCGEHCELNAVTNQLRLRNMELRSRETKQLQRIKLLENEVEKLNRANTET